MSGRFDYLGSMRNIDRVLAQWNSIGMKSCGYVIRLVAVDRAIVNSQSVGHVSADSSGFCLEK